MILFNDSIFLNRLFSKNHFGKNRDNTKKSVFFIRIVSSLLLGLFTVNQLLSYLKNKNS